MARFVRIGLIVALAAGMVAMVALQFRGASSVAAEPVAPAKPAVERTGVPKLIDLGSTECIPCKLMWPILEEMKKEYDALCDRQGAWDEDNYAGRRYQTRIDKEEADYENENFRRNRGK